MLIINGTVHTMDGLTIPNGYVAVSGDKIAKVGPMEECPDHWEGETLDARQGHILPGFIDAHCHLGMFGDALGFEADDGNEATDPCTPHLRAIDAVNPLDRCFEEARQAGVTTVLTGPGSANPISGQFAAIKTTGKWVDAMVVQAPAAMKLALGENPKCVYNERHETPVTRMATAAIIRENLAKALEYGEKLERAAEDEEEDKPDYDAKLEALLPVVRGELPVHIHAHRADDIATAIRISKEFGLKCVIVHGTEAVSYTHLDVYKRQIIDLLIERRVGGDAPLIQIICKEVCDLTIPVYHEHLVRLGGEMADPVQQVIPVGVGRQTGEIQDAGPDGDLLTKELYTFGPLQQTAAQSALPLIAHKDHSAFGAP